MFVVPTVKLVTKPVAEIVATAVLEETHGVVAFAVIDPVNCEVANKQTESVPVIVGFGFTVNVAVIEQPFEFK